MGIRLFILYFTAVVGGILAIQLALISLILYFGGGTAVAIQVIIATAIATLWALTGVWRIRKGDHECRSEVAKTLFPIAVFYTLLSSIGLVLYFELNVPETGKNPYLLIIAAIPIIGYLILRWSEVRFMRSLKD